MKKFVCVICLATFLCGCIGPNSPMSMNYQRCIARTSGDLSSTILLEKKYEKISPEKVIDTCNTIKDYIDTVNLSSITREELRSQINKIIKIQGLKSLAYKVISKVPEGQNLQESKKVMIEFLDGVILGAVKFNPDEVLKPEPDVE